MTETDWQHGGGFSAPGIGERAIPWPSHNATGLFGAANPTCATCGGRLRGAKKCDCAEPDWRVKGEKVDVPKDLPAEGELPAPAHESDDVLLYLGDSIEVMRAMPPASVDAIVSDPPYGLEFMGNQWDSFRTDDPGTKRWRGEKAGAQGSFSVPEGLNHPSELPSYGGKRPKTSRCSGCGKRDQFRKPHDCVEGAEWVDEFIRPNEAPPSMLAFQEWTRQWATEAFRVLKPGGWLVAFSGTRTYHRTAAGVEDAGFEVRDQIHWLYGSGFPKSMNVGLAIDDELGVEHRTEKQTVYVDSTLLEEGGEREVDVTKTSGIGTAFDAENGTWAQGKAQTFAVKRPGSAEGQQWEGYGTALKPGHEPCVLARKPFAVTVAKNVLEHGTGVLNIGGSLVGSTKEVPSSPRRAEQGPAYGDLGNASGGEQGFDPNVGRWPANIVLSHSEGCRPLGRAKVDGDGHWPAARGAGGIATTGHGGQEDLPERDASDEVELFECADDCPVLAMDRQAGTVEAIRMGVGGGGPSRFFYVAKPSPAEKDAGLNERDFPPIRQPDEAHPADGPGANNPRNRSAKPRLNNHPTVKPIDLMAYLVKLVTPPGGVVLDPFMGSGTTGCAAVREGFRFVGCDLDDRHVRMAAARIEHWRPSQLSLI